MTISILLASPQMGENIGATARAMKNFGITDLRIINPRDGWPNEKAESMAAGAIDIINNASIHNDMNSCVNNINKIYALTARSRDMNKPHFYLHELEKNIDLSINNAFMFGRENSGLSNEEIALADGIISIDTDPEYTSLNIAQSVILTCHQIFQISNNNNSNNNKQDLCDKSQLVFFYDILENILDEKGFFYLEEKKPQMLLNLKNIFARNNLSKTELQTLIGIIKLLGK